MREKVAPLPSRSLILSKFSCIHLKPGIFLPVQIHFAYMKAGWNRRGDVNFHLAVVGFDELGLDKVGMYDIKLDLALGVF